MHASIRLIKISPEMEITRTVHADLFYELQNAILLSLKDEGHLTLMQYHHAAEILKEQRMNVLHAKFTESGDWQLK